MLRRLTWRLPGPLAGAPAAGRRLLHGGRGRRPSAARAVDGARQVAWRLLGLLQELDGFHTALAPLRPRARREAVSGAPRVGLDEPQGDLPAWSFRVSSF